MPPPTKKKTARAPAGRRPSPEATRQAMFVAAMEVIAEVGYYRASSNEIARRSGFTWGVIQHHFRSREGLLGAVIDSTIDEVLAFFRRASIEGATVEARVACFCDLIFAVYAAPKYVATLQILLDLARDPAHGTPLRAAVNRFTKVSSAETLRLASEVRREAVVTREFADVLAELTWGVAMMEHVGRIYWAPATARRRTRARRAALVQMVTTSIRALPTAPRAATRSSSR